MNKPFEERLPFFALGLAVLAIFYGIYFTKMFVQKKHGIQTRQIGKRKEKKLHTVEQLMSLATGNVVIAQLLSIAFDWNYMPSSARFTGFCIGILGDLVFLISVLCMKDSWRAGIPESDKTKLVTDGIYKYSRNPAFFGFDLMYIGVLLMFFNPVNLILSLFPIIMLHLQILQEEKYMEATFGEEYITYKKKTFRYLGNKPTK
mgnify:CR=1 FL=1